MFKTQESPWATERVFHCKVFNRPKCNLTNFFFTIMMASRDTRDCKSLRQLASATNNFVCFGRTKMCCGTAQRGQAEATTCFVCTDNLCRYVKLFAKWSCCGGKSHKLEGGWICAGYLKDKILIAEVKTFANKFSMSQTVIYRWLAVFLLTRRAYIFITKALVHSKDRGMRRLNAFRSLR